MNNNNGYAILRKLILKYQNSFKYNSALKVKLPQIKTLEISGHTNKINGEIYVKQQCGKFDTNYWELYAKNGTYTLKYMQQNIAFFLRRQPLWINY